jgi:cysteine desulfurase
MPVYLDYNATAPVRPEAAEAVADALDHVGNASSVHRYGRDARRRVERAREAVATLVGAPPPAVVFAAGGTEANNMALRGALAAAPGSRLLVSAGEHDCVLRQPGAEPVPLTGDGLVDTEALEAALAAQPHRPALVSVMLANNETGAIQPVRQVVEIARRHGARVHCDAVQAPGKIPVDAAELGVDLMTLSAHKLGGPQGAGALLVLDDGPLAPIASGGGQERGRRPGTENVAAIAGFGAAAACAAGDLERMAEIAAWRDRLEARARELAPSVQVHGAGAPRLPNTSCLGLPGVRAETQVMALDLAGVAVSSGSACSSGKVHPSHVLQAMGLDRDAAGQAIRVSLGWASEAGDVDRFLEAWGRLARKHAPGAAADAA